MMLFFCALFAKVVTTMVKLIQLAVLLVLFLTARKGRICFLFRPFSFSEKKKGMKGVVK